MIIVKRDMEGNSTNINIHEEHLFLGNCQGAALVSRGIEDDHICIHVLAKDDGRWFTSDGYFSSFWMSDLQDQLKRADEWMENNAEKDPSGFGYVFKK